jgi:hypothetical protein
MTPRAPVRPDHPAWLRKDHPQRDQEEHHPARDAERLLRDREHAKYVAAEVEEDEQEPERKHRLAQEDPPPPCRRHVLEKREQHRDVPQRIHDQEHQQERRQNRHRRLTSGRF